MSRKLYVGNLPYETGESELPELDLRDATMFNTLQVGDLVAFDLVDDQVSGARAICVVLARPRRLAN